MITVQCNTKEVLQSQVSEQQPLAALQMLIFRLTIQLQQRAGGGRLKDALVDRIQNSFEEATRRNINS